jgi:hypothetical protein
MLGLDETRARSLRWAWAEDGWRLSNPWMTSFVDLDLGRPGWLLGLVPGRSQVNAPIKVSESHTLRAPSRSFLLRR